MYNFCDLEGKSLLELPNPRTFLIANIKKFKVQLKTTRKSTVNILQFLSRFNYVYKESQTSNKNKRSIKKSKECYKIKEDDKSGKRGKEK